MKSMKLILYIGIVSSFVVEVNSQAQRRVSGRVQAAIEATKRRQSYHSPVAAVATTDKSRNNKSQQQRPIKTEDLDVHKLNQMIKAIDKSWVLPRTGSRDPVGSNFQAYKKTCATIYKSREGACQQVGFGVMCFNYCFEQGEQMSYKCQDISDSTYCKTNSNFESFLGKHKKDSYKVKAFIHQMISRCYATTVCSATGIFSEAVMNKILGNGSTTAGATASPKEKKLIKANKKASTDIKAAGTMQRNGKPNIWERFAAQQPNRQQATRAPEDTSNSGVIGPSPADPSDQPKMVPFWQRLLKRKKENTTTTTTQRTPEPTTDPITEYPEEEVVEEEVVTTTTQAPTKPKRRRVKQKKVKTTTTTTTEATDLVPEEVPEEEEEEYVVVSQNKPEPTAVSKHTWKPLQKTFTSKPFIAAHSNLGEIIEQVEKGQDPPGVSSHHEPEGFWNKFQPGRWFQSIHYMTNTG
ncbi:unnamed protein product [Bursaphelenchus xylophilus]|uniref:(pine wood nematode) hypothetical protein n=1 Tax=Bursaphelenchus xylophilus TaxID=6326 RepID=A0A7I8XK51_BURXY|nr:unnamed protein product [Bursaphelenchus xylophilus]CAG9120881.1 unnamed protein product [Bursaphelenchus xylophilus]